MTALASIPSPSTGTWDLGPFSVHMYGLMLLLAVAACTALTAVRWVRGWAWNPNLDGVVQIDVVALGDPARCGRLVARPQQRLVPPAFDALGLCLYLKVCRAHLFSVR